MTSSQCNDCGEPLPMNLTQCPHCGRPSLFPNVQTASVDKEREALDSRLAQAQKDLTARGVNAIDEFATVLGQAEVVINRYFGELRRLAWSDDQVYATYYGRTCGELQLPESDQWNLLRGIVDTIMFGDSGKGQIRFGAMSLDDLGLENYGDCSMVVKRGMIEHRTSVFEENSVVFFRKHNISGANDFRMPMGYRAPWSRRVDLCMSKLAARLQPATIAGEYPRILLSSSQKPEEDDFVEVHIWGMMTIRSLARVSVRKWVLPPAAAEVDVVRARLSLLRVQFRIP